MDKEKSCTIGGACGIGLLGIFCPVCVPAIGAFVTSIGLGFAATTTFMYPMLGLMSAMFLLGLLWDYRHRRNIWLLLLGTIGVLAIPIGRYIISSLPLVYGGVGVVMATGLWSLFERGRNVTAVARLLMSIAALSLLGFLGYRFGFLEIIQGIMMGGNLGKFSTVALSILFGTAAFFSPCALTVLPAYISYFLGKEDTERQKPSITELLSLGVIGALGIIVVNMALGLVIAALGSAAPFAKDPREDIVPILAIRTIAGLLIALMGYLTITGKRLPIPFVQELIASGSLRKSVFTYGIFYNAAAVGCTGPILLGLMLYAFQLGEAKAALSAFSVFSLVMGAWMVLLTLLAGLFKGAIMQRIATPLPALRTVTGITMLIVGLSVAILTLEGNSIFVKLFFPFLP